MDVDDNDDYYEEDDNDDTDEEDGNDDSDEDCWRRLCRWDTWPAKQRDYHQPEPSSSTNTAKAVAQVLAQVLLAQLVTQLTQ